MNLFLGLALSCAATARAAEPPLSPDAFARIGALDERFQSYNVEMIEVTGGWFWKPYDTPPSPGAPSGVDPARYGYRSPIDLANPRLRALAAALGPAYVRVSGTWANAVYFHDSADKPPVGPPPGFEGVLTRGQWRGVVEFAHQVDAELVTSFAISPGTRDTEGRWAATQAQALVDYTRSLGGRIAAAEFMNEPNLPAISRAPAGYDAAAFGRDIAAFSAFLKRTSPTTLHVGPGSTGEDMSAAGAGAPMGTRRLLAATGPAFDVFSYHFYGALSERCGDVVPLPNAPDRALAAGWLSATATVETYFASLRDRFAPGRPIWITETAEAACGGNRWAATFLDTFRYLDQLGRLAQRGVQAVFHNTLAASDYGLIDETTLEPRPNYWAALLWRRLMGTVVLDPGPSPRPNLYLYAHCQRASRGGVALLAINADRTTVRAIDVPAGSRRYTLSAAALTDRRVRLNGSVLQLGANNEMPPLEGIVGAARVELAPLTMTFLTLPARNPACG